MFGVHIRAFLSLPTCLWRIEEEFLITDSGLCHLKLLFVPWTLEEEEPKKSYKETWEKMRCILCSYSQISLATDLSLAR